MPGKKKKRKKEITLEVKLDEGNNQQWLLLTHSIVVYVVSYKV